MYKNKKLMFIVIILLSVFTYTENSIKSISNFSIKNINLIKDTTNNVLTINNSSFKPDTSINGLTLRNNETINDFLYKGILHLLPESKIRPYPVVYFSNKKGTEYLAAYKYYGDFENEFSQFEVGTSIVTDSISKTSYDYFYSDSKIKLGMALHEVLTIKGEADTLQQNDGMKILRYSINDQNSQFLQKYKMPSYFAEYYFKEDTLIKFIFGFDYP